MRPVRAVLFDLDGTLVDSETHTDEAISAVVARYGIAGFALPHSETRGRTWSHVADVIREQTGIESDAALLADELLTYWVEAAAQVTPIPGAPEAVRTAAAQNLKLGVVSGSPRAVIDSFLDKLGVADCIDQQARIGGDAVRRSKPDPEGYLLGARALDVDPAETLVFEDSQAGLLAARAAGMRSMFITCCASDIPGNTRLATASCTHYLDSPAALLGRAGGRPPRSRRQVVHLNASNPELLRRYRVQLFVATWLSYCGFYVVRKVYAVVKLPLKEHFGLDDVQIAYPWTIYLITYMLGQFLAAWLGKRAESRRIIAWGMCVTAACNIVLGLLVDSEVASAYLWMCVTMGIHGLAQATGWPHNVALFANWTRRSERGTYFGIWGTCYQFGAIFGKGLAGFLLGWLGLAWSFFGSSVLLLLFTVYFVLRARERPQSVGLSLEDEAEPDVPVPKLHEAPAQESVLPRGFVVSIVAMGLIYFGFKFLRYALDSWSALILGEHFGMTTSIAAYWSTAFDWIGFLGVIVAGFWSDRLPGSRRTPVIFWMTAGCLVFTCAMWLVGLTSPFLFVALLGLIGFTAMGPDSLLSGACAMDVGSRRQAALAAGVINGFGSIGPILQEPAIGWLKKTQGLDAVFLLLVVIVFLTTVATGLLARFERRRGV